MGEGDVHAPQRAHVPGAGPTNGPRKAPARVQTPGWLMLPRAPVRAPTPPWPVPMPMPGEATPAAGAALDTCAPDTCALWALLPLLLLLLLPLLVPLVMPLLLPALALLLLLLILLLAPLPPAPLVLLLYVACVADSAVISTARPAPPPTLLPADPSDTSAPGGAEAAACSRSGCVGLWVSCCGW